MRWLLALLSTGCVARSEPVRSAFINEPPFTFEVVGDPAGITIDLRSGARGTIALDLASDDGHDRRHDAWTKAPGLKRYALDPKLGWTLTARWTDPDGVAGATAVRHVPDVSRVAPRFEPVTPRRLGALLVDSAVRPK